MNRTELLELIRSGEKAGVAFKRDDGTPEGLAGTMAGLLNREGGHILLGVEDDRTVSGLTRDRRQVEEWVVRAAQDRLDPAVIPYWRTVNVGGGRFVGVVTLPRDAPEKPYKARCGSAWVTRVRLGATTHQATREEEQLLYERAAGPRYGLTPVRGTEMDALDSRRLKDYFGRVVRVEGSFPSHADEWARLLVNLGLATTERGRTVPTVNGTLLFGRNPTRALPQSGVRALCYPGEEQDYATRADEDLTGSLVPLLNEEGLVVEPGLVDQAWDFVRRNTTPSAHLEGTRRADRWEYPESVVREAVANALVHRDYSITGTDVLLVIYSNRLEVVSPGRLPGTLTPRGMRSGVRFARNQTLVNVMRDYGYVDTHGMGVRKKIVPGMRAHNGTDPELEEEEYRFTVRLWK